MKTTGLVLTFALARFLLTPANAQVPDQLKHAIPAPPSGGQDAFGSGVAMDASHIVIGLPGSASLSGAVAVFNSTTGAQLFVLANPNPAAGYSGFGASVAVSGTRVVVAAAADDMGAENSGRAYVYDLSSATPTVPALTLNNPSPAGYYDYFGHSVAISGTRVVIGAYLDDEGAPEAGRAYVYDLSSPTPSVPVAALNNPSPANNGRFGVSVAISGQRVVVGADENIMAGVPAGRAYVYDLSSNTPTVPAIMLTYPNPAAGDLFGGSVAISDLRVVVGAHRDDTVTSDTGSAYVYDLGRTTPGVPVATLNNPNPSVFADFGASVSISGTRVAVGAWRDDTGASDAGRAYVYDLGSARPAVPVATLNNPSPSPDEYFGRSLAMSGMRVAVGAPREVNGNAYVYNLHSGTPTVPEIKLDNPKPAPGSFGDSVAISGTRMVVGAHRNNTRGINAGSAYVYDFSSATPTVPVATLINPGLLPVTYDWFGYSVSISGTRVVVGAYLDDIGGEDAGSVYVYDLNSVTPTLPVLTLNKTNGGGGYQFGFSVAISGTRIVVGTVGGGAFVYDLNRITPTVPVLTLTGSSDNYFGYSVAISGTRVVVGAHQSNVGAIDSGSAYVYDLTSATPTVPVTILNKPSPARDDSFGFSVAISGTRVVVGATGDDTGARDTGSAYVYDLGSATPTIPVATLDNPSPAIRDFFGSSVAISGTRVVVGALRDDSGTTDAGSAYVYDLSSATPTVPVATLHNPHLASDDNFSRYVAIDGTSIAVGASSNDSVTEKGYAYVYGPSHYSLWKVAELSDQFASDSGDGDGDGLGNLGEYGLLCSPTTPEGTSFGAASALYSEGERLRLFVLRDPARNDLTLEVQATGDLLLGPWTTIATSTLGAPFIGPGYFGGDSATPGVKSVEVRDTVNLPDAPQRFLRVRVRR